MEYKDILEYWFGELDEYGRTDESRFKLWFGKSEETDQYLTENYKDLLESAKRGELDSWKESAEGLVAFIVLLDQFSRNIYRDTAEMYAADEQVLSVAKRAVETGVDKEMPISHRVFTYLPFMHSENLEDQEQCIELFKGLQNEVPEEVKKSIQGNIDYAIKHRDVVKGYGRFPHRNEILGRESIEEEKVYLSNPDAGF